MAAPHEADTTIPPALQTNPHYRIERELGRGGMGVVYLAHNTLLDRKEVLKVIGRGLLDRPGASDRFLREMRSAARLNHPNVVAAYTALADGSFLALAMEYVPGDDLAKIVRRVGPLSVQQACFYTAQAAAGLQHAHEHGMVHRDIKPSNLMLSTAGKKPVVKILDFGLAKVSQYGQPGGLTASGAMLGTPEYMAPEQALDAAAADIRSDIYSLGCTLYFLLVGETPYPASNIYAIMHAHQTSPLPDPSRFRKDVTDDLVKLVEKMTAKRPIDRFQTPVQVAKALKPYFTTGLTTELPAVNAASRPPTLPPTQPRVIVVEVVDESTASGESVRPVQSDEETAPPKDKTPVYERPAARSYQIDHDQFNPPLAASERVATRRSRRSLSTKKVPRRKGVPLVYFVIGLALLGLGSVVAVLLPYRPSQPDVSKTATTDVSSSPSRPAVITEPPVQSTTPDTSRPLSELGWLGDTEDWRLVNDEMVYTHKGTGRAKTIYQNAGPSSVFLTFEMQIVSPTGEIDFVIEPTSASTPYGLLLSFGKTGWADLHLFSGTILNMRREALVSNGTTEYSEKDFNRVSISLFNIENGQVTYTINKQTPTRSGRTQSFGKVSRIGFSIPPSSRGDIRIKKFKASAR